MDPATTVARERVSRQRLFAGLGAALAGLAVVAGAFGAHALEGVVSPERIEVFETGVLYHLVHAVALLGVAWAIGRWPSTWTVAAGWLLVAGITIFSGSLYLLVLTDTPWLGAITPIGGVSFIVGWASLAAGVFSSD